MIENFKLKAVLFDMDGLMIDSEPLSQRAWQRALSDWGYTLTPETYARVIGITVRNALEIYKEVFGPDAPIDTIFVRKQQYFDEILANDGMVIKAGLLDLVDWLDGHGIARAVASSTSRPLLNQKLATAGLTGKFDVIASGDEVQHGKPAPDIFLLAAERLGIAPANCVVLEDSNAGIKAAQAAGMLPVMVPDLLPPTEETKTLTPYIFTSLVDVKKFLEGLVV
jgi:HAD superfamily hydrolase (TIGR01509 family)